MSECKIINLKHYKDLEQLKGIISVTSKSFIIQALSAVNKKHSRLGMIALQYITDGNQPICEFEEVDGHPCFGMRLCFTPESIDILIKQLNELKKDMETEQ